jgi:septal ring factor EnvC (AmiA/AmiB activator)
MNMKIHPVLWTLMLTACVCLTPDRRDARASSDAPSEATQDQIKEIETQLSREKQKLEAFHSRERDILSQLAELEQEVALKRRAMNRISDKMRRTREEMDLLGKELENLERVFMRVEVQVSRRLIALYKHGRKGYLRVLGDASDLEQFWRQAKYLGAVMKEERETLARLTQEARRQKREMSRLKESLSEKGAVRKEEEARLSALRGQLEKKVIQLMKIHKEKEFYETAVEELQIAATHLKHTLLSLEKKTTYRSDPASPFADFKGRLPSPLEGKVIRAEKLSRSRRTGRGVFVEGTSDPRVRAVFPGRIDFSGRIKGYGEVVVVNHGERYFTISARLLRRERQEGETVAGGDVIGRAGATGSSKGMRVYFEIRRAGQSLDPMAWLKIH